jgi:glutamate-1-semialdehyde 2,1-aminomutase
MKTPDQAEQYTKQHVASQRLYERAQNVLPSGVTHDSRFFDPFPLYIERAQGSKKWDVGGNEYIDYWMGHGALLLGHGHPDVVVAVEEQVRKGMHYGGSCELEIEWAELIVDTVPSAEVVKFCSSGTEATMLAVRLARSFTGRPKVVKFQGHFHGWHDYAQAGILAPFDVPSATGIPDAALGTMLVVPPNDIAALRNVLEANAGDVAAIIMEPAGASTMVVPTMPGFLELVRKLTSDLGIVLIFDEVVTGFRFAPGGAQESFGITPDLTGLGKIVAGGMPGGAVAGKREIMELLEIRDDPHWNRFRRVSHPGTHNANPVCAAAGIATMKLARTGEPQRRADHLAALMRDGLNEVIARQGIPGCVYGESSIFRILLGPEAADAKPDQVYTLDPGLLMRRMGSLAGKISLALRNRGVDTIRGDGGFLSSAHDESDVARSVDAFSEALDDLKLMGELRRPDGRREVAASV